MFPFEMANCWRPSRSLFGERPRASINRASHQRRRGRLEIWYNHSRERGRGERTHPSSSSHQLKNTSREAVLPLYCPSSAPEAIHHTTHWSRVLHHNGDLNQYKHRVSCVVHHFHLSSHERIGRRSVGERSPRAPQCSNLKGLPEPETRQSSLARP